MSQYEESDSEGEEVGESSDDDSEYQVILARDRSGRLVYMGDDDWYNSLLSSDDAGDLPINNDDLEDGILPVLPFPDADSIWGPLRQSTGGTGEASDPLWFVCEENDDCEDMFRELQEKHSNKGRPRHKLDPDKKREDFRDKKKWKAYRRKRNVQLCRKRQQQRLGQLVAKAVTYRRMLMDLFASQDVPKDLSKKVDNII